MDSVVANEKAVSHSPMEGGGADGYIRRAFCLLFGDRQYHCSYSEQKEITAPSSKCSG